MPEISIIMPVYNTEKYLENTLNSLVNQTFKDFELICVNDGSTDNSLEVLENFKSKFDFIKIFTQKNSGTGVARNYGFSQTKGRLVLFLDSDDYFHPDFLEKMYNKYLETNADIVICRYDVVLPNGELYQKNTGINTAMLPQKETFNKNDFPEYLFNFVNLAAWNKLIKADLIKKHKLEFENIPDSNDVFFTLSAILFADKIAIVDEPLIQYNFFTENSTTVKRNKNLNIYVFETFKKLQTQINNENELLKRSLYNTYLSSIMYTLNFLRGEIRRQFLKLIKKNVPLEDKKNVYNVHQYYRLLFIKKLPINIYIILHKLRCIIKNSLNFVLKIHL